MNMSDANRNDLPLQPEPRLTPSGFGRDCTVGDKLQLRCLRKAVGEYFFARRGARQMLEIGRNLLQSSPRFGTQGRHGSSRHALVRQ